MRRTQLGAALVGLPLMLACAAPAAPPSKPPAATAASAPAAASTATAGPAAASAPTSGPAAASAAAPAAAAASAAPQAAPSQRATVRVAGVAGIIDRALWTGEAKGYYQEQGIGLEIENFTTTVDMVPQLATGRVDAGHGATNAGFFNAVATGVPLKLVSDVTILRPPAEGVRNTYQIVIRGDVADQVRSVADLRGMKVATNAAGAQVHLEYALQYHGLSLNDVQWENVSFPEQPTALANRAIDGATAIEPFVTLGQERGILLPLFDMGHAMPYYPVQSLFYSADFIQSQTETARRFMVAYMKALRYLEDAVTKRQNWDEVVQLHVANTPVKDAAVYEKMAATYQETNGNVNAAALERDQEQYLRRGDQRQRIDLRALVDASFAEYAVGQLGRYQP